MLCIEREFVDNVLPGQRLLRAAAQMRLALLDHAAVLHDGSDMAGIAVRVWILGIDHVFHFGGEREQFWIPDRGFGKCAQPNAAMDKAGCQQIRRGELGGIAVARALLVGERLP